MTMTNSLNAQKRDGTGKGVARKLRQNGRVPAVMYGKDMDATSLSIDAMEAGHLFAAISVENTILEIQIEGEKESEQVLVRAIQSHPHKQELIHVDFLRIQKGVAVDVEVPIELIGTPKGVKDEGGNLEHLVHEIEVRCIPSLIPQVIELDVSGLGLEEALHVSDLVLPEGVEVTIEDDRPICMVSTPRAAAEDDEDGEDEGEGEAGEPEVIGQEED